MDKPGYVYAAVRNRGILNRPACIYSGHRRSFILLRPACSFSVQACIFQMNITYIRLQNLISRRETFLAGMKIVDCIQIRPECFILKMFHDCRHQFRSSRRIMGLVFQHKHFLLLFRIGKRPAPVAFHPFKIRFFFQIDIVAVMVHQIRAYCNSRINGTHQKLCIIFRRLHGRLTKGCFHRDTVDHNILPPDYLANFFYISVPVTKTCARYVTGPQFVMTNPIFQTDIHNRFKIHHIAQCLS